MAQESNEETRLVKCFLLATRFWTNYFSLTSFPFCRPEDFDDNPTNRVRGVHRREIAALFALGSAIAFFCWIGSWDGASWLHRLAAGAAVYRILDLGVSLLRIGVAGSIRDRNKTVEQLGPYRIVRVLLLVLCNYLELLFWFAIVYLALDAGPGCHFYPRVDEPSEAFFVSMTTMTTVGYGNIHPRTAWALGLTTTQTTLGLLILVIVVGRMVALAIRRKPEPDLLAELKKILAQDGRVPIKDVPTVVSGGSPAASGWMDPIIRFLDKWAARLLPLVAFGVCWAFLSQWLLVHFNEHSP